MELLRELEVLHYNLSQLDVFLRSKGAIRFFDSTSVLVTSTSACRTKLTVLFEKLNRAGDSLVSRMKWPLNSKEHRDTVQDLRAFAQWIQFALTIDGCALLSKTSAEAGNARPPIGNLPIDQGTSFSTLFIQFGGFREPLLLKLPRIRSASP